MRSDLALFGGQTGAIRLWDIQPGATLVERAFLQGHDSPVTAVAFSPDGTTLASSGGRAFLRVDATDNMFGIALWDVDTVTLIDGLRGHTADVLALQFNTAGSVLYSASLDGSIRMWDTATFQQTALAQYPVNDIALSPDGMLLAAGLANGDVALLDAATLEEQATVTAHTASVNSVAFNSDGSLLVSGGDDANAYVWEVSAALSGDAPVEPQLLTGHFDSVTDVAFSPDDGLIATLSDDNAIRLWGITPTFG
jgi:WD40 repeat protein